MGPAPLILLDPWFWVMALAGALVLPLRLGIPRSAAFGVLNILALYLLVGSLATVLVVSLATALWLILSRGAVWPGLAGVAVLYLTHKVAMDRGTVALVGLQHGRRLFAPMAAIGLSYVFLRSWDLVATVRNGRAPLLDPLSLAGYLAPFHMLAAGPINSYEAHVSMNAGAPPASDFDTLLGGVNKAATGLFYKFVLAEGLRIFAFGASGPLLSRSWFDDALLFIYVFFDFAGYSLVALAVGRLSGIPTPVNFSAPFASSSVTEFWTRWHMSLGDFARRRLYLPLQLRLVRAWGIRRAYLITVLTLVLSFAFVGLWHRLSLRFLLWGISMGVFLVLEKLVRDRVMVRQGWLYHGGGGRLLRLAGPVYVFVVLTTSLHFVMRELLRP